MDDQKFIEEWEKRRNKGKIRYCIEMVIASFGGGITGILIMYLLGKVRMESVYYIVIGVGMGSMCGGIIDGLRSWSRSDQKYKNINAQKNEEPNE